MQELFESIENSAFSTYIRETPNVLGYSTVLALHTFGMAFLVGLSGVIALRVLGGIVAVLLPAGWGAPVWASQAASWLP